MIHLIRGKTELERFALSIGYGNTEENDLALTSDGKTIMIVMRTDGDGPCHPPSNGMGEQGVYRPYFQSYSRDNGATWDAMTPIAGTGCARPRLLSLGAGKPMLLSGGRMCVENTSGLFVWLNPTVGKPRSSFLRVACELQGQYIPCVCRY